MVSKLSKDASYNFLHLHASHHADLLEEFNRTLLQPDDIFVPSHLQPLNPEDEDDVVPDQHAAFGITRATQTVKEPVWRDLGLEELLKRKPEGTEDLGKKLKAVTIR
ncbi:Apc13 domain protein [Eremomyces bilateralis CBS 781.70]|uniref:Apc13 domain protein n=1 Tax=Eremomyces bilateralis CBS 781.70 TaxID=1392243 RepID=A0A6G1GAJ3_9PEZI|nr:Apc13 domain protein [Eremomyces bilateralis CBS 781.70]KAF1815053.1 Apc13 domain protein [Eremomyces bilateralis CBS 781.70]